MLSKASYSVMVTEISSSVSGQANAKFTKARSLNHRSPWSLVGSSRQQFQCSSGSWKEMVQALCWRRQAPELWEHPLHFPQGQPNTEAAFYSTAVLHLISSLWGTLFIYVMQSYIKCYWTYTHRRIYFLQLNCLYWLWDLKALNTIWEHSIWESVSMHDKPR